MVMVAAKKVTGTPKVIVIDRKPKGRKKDSVSNETVARRAALDDLWENGERVTLTEPPKENAEGVMEDGKVITDQAVDLTPVLAIFPRTGHAQIVAKWAESKGHKVTVIAGQYLAPKL